MTMMSKPKQFPKWMLKNSDTNSSSLQNSNSSLLKRSSSGNRVHSKKTVYCMTEKELVETAKEILNKAKKDHFSGEKALESEACAQKQFNKGVKINKTIVSDVEYSCEDLFSTEDSGENEADTKDSKIMQKPDLSALDEIFL